MLFLPMIFGKWLNQLDIFSFLTVGMLMYNPYLVYNLSFFCFHAFSVFLLETYFVFSASLIIRPTTGFG